jgi:hypothetical protein
MRASFGLASLVAVVLAAPLLDCTSFPAIAENSCGNGVLDPGEDCDTFPQGAGTVCGGAGGPAPCHLLCGALAQGATCPPGWGCGSSGICAQPSGAYTQVGGAISAGAWRVDLGDFDGNGSLDALTRGTVGSRGFSQIRVQFFDSSFGLQDTFVPAPLVAQPQILDMNGDGLSDIVFEYGDVFGIVGVGVMTGNSSRKLTQVPYPVIDLPGVVRYYALPFDNGTFATCAYNQVNGTTNLLDLTPTTKESTIVPLATGTTPSLVGGFVLAPVFVSAAHPCYNLVFAYGGALGTVNEVNVVSPCTVGPGDNWGDVAKVEVTVDPAAYISYPPRVADVDGDGNADLLIPVSKPASDETVIAYGDGKGAFWQKPGMGGVRNHATVVLQYTSTLPTGGTVELPVGPILQTGDLNGDGVSDLITVDGIYLSNPGPQPSWSASVIDHAWTDAIVGDFNRDGIPDVFAGNASTPNLYFFAGIVGSSSGAPDAGSAGDGGDGGGAPDAAAAPQAFALAQAFVPTSGGISHFTVGDFDGDGTNDLAFSQEDPTGDASDDVDIVYGVPFQFPGAPVPVGRFDSVQQTLTIPATATTAVSLVVVSAPQAAPTSTSFITYLPSTGARPPLSSFVLNTTSGGVTSFGDVEAFVAASFTKGMYPDVTALAFDVDTQGNIKGQTLDPMSRTWLMPNDGSPAQFKAPIPDTALVPSSLAPVGVGAHYVAALMTAGDVTGDGVPESIILGPSCAPGDAPGACIRDGTLLTGAFDSVSGTFAYVSTPLKGIVVSQEGQVALQDVDGDGFLDLVILSGSTADSGAGTDAICAAARSLWVLWNDGKGAFSLENAAEVASGATGCDTPRAFTFLRRDATQPPALVFVTRTAVRYAALGPSRTLTVLPLGSGLSSLAPKDCCSSAYSGNEYTGIAGGDIDGDGVDDFALVNDGDLFVFQGVPRTPGPAQ